MHGDLWVVMCSLTSKDQFLRPSCFLWNREQDIAMSQLLVVSTGIFRCLSNYISIRKGMEADCRFTSYIICCHFEYVWRKLRFPSRSITRKFCEEGVLAKIYQKHEVSYRWTSTKRWHFLDVRVVIKTSEIKRPVGKRQHSSIALDLLSHHNYSMEINRLPRVGEVISVTTQAMGQ